MSEAQKQQLAGWTEILTKKRKATAAAAAAKADTASKAVISPTPISAEQALASAENFGKSLATSHGLAARNAARGIRVWEVVLGITALMCSTHHGRRCRYRILR